MEALCIIRCIINRSMAGLLVRFLDDVIDVLLHAADLRPRLAKLLNLCIGSGQPCRTGDMQQTLVRILALAMPGAGGVLKLLQDRLPDLQGVSQHSSVWSMLGPYVTCHT
jgi:nucleoside-diphosphate-sugar epimerase